MTIKLSKHLFSLERHICNYALRLKMNLESNYLCWSNQYDTCFSGSTFSGDEDTLVNALMLHGTVGCVSNGIAGEWREGAR